MQRAEGGINVINATPPLAPVQGKAPIVFALPALVGHRDRLRQQLSEAFAGRPDSIFLIPTVRGNKSVVWRVFWENGHICTIEEYNAFANASSLVDKGLGDEENRERIQARLGDPGFLSHKNALWLPEDIGRYALMPMPPDGVHIVLNQQKALILTIAERDPTYFDLAATPCRNLQGEIRDTIKFNTSSNGRQMFHSGDCTFQSAAPRGGKSMQVLAQSVGAQKGAPAFAVTVSGYTNTPLIRFEKWRPTVAAIDHESRTIYYCGVRLDEATAGNNTVCVVMVCNPISKDSSETHVWSVPGPYGKGDCRNLPPSLFEGLAK